MTLALMARFLLDPRSVWERKETHDLAHAIAAARRRAALRAPARSRRIRSR